MCNLETKLCSITPVSIMLARLHSMSLMLGIESCRIITVIVNQWPNGY